MIVFVLNKSHEDSQLSFSQRTSLLTLLFKKDDPLKLPVDNHRPISLLNVDLKLLSYTLAQRLNKILPKLINEDQTGYIKNWFIGFNLRQIQDIIDYSNIYKIEGAIIFSNLSKAFDSLEWDFMFSTLKHYGFNDSFVTWVETLYNNIQTCVINNRWISDFLFVISVEIMALKRENKNINGIKV